MTPGSGAVGRVRAVGPDATRLRVGDWVLCDPTVRSRDDALTPDITLQGLSARGQGGLRLQEHFGQGPFAEQLLTRPGCWISVSSPSQPSVSTTPTRPSHTPPPKEDASA
ncbi:hypothetical protein [Streptomyces sp. NPDC048644]|uniref:hypothetical protein n=1 Tax=Streptomyces sp. NPDC048644 TaxID=3365582 RepID=UPI0037127B22